MNFSKQTILKFIPTIAAALLFFIVSALYFAPQFIGEKLPQHDVIQYEGMAADIKANQKNFGEDPQWTGGMFGGMPAYLINVAYPSQLIKQGGEKFTSLIDRPAAFILFSMAAMWIMLLIFGVNPWVSIVPALAYGLSTYFLLIIGAGHLTKMWALVYAPLMMAGAHMTLRRNMWIGAVVTLLFTSLEIGANHPQITYYFILAMAALWISEAIVAYRQKMVKMFAKRTAILALAGIIAVGSNLSPLWYTAQHTKDTIRGGSELTVADNIGGKEGLDYEYATAWSYGRGESLNLLIPDFMGRQSATTFSSDGQVAESLKKVGLDQSFAQQLPMYWGAQPYTGGPTYLGAVIILLAAIGIALSQGRNRWWIIAISILTLFLAWGDNMMWFTELMFNYLPGYNKFRTVSTILVVIQWTVPLLGAYGLTQLWSKEIDTRRKLNATLWSTSIVGGVCLILAVAGGLFFDFGREDSINMMTQQFSQILSSNNMTEYLSQGMDIEMGKSVGEAMANERIALMSADSWRSLIFILLTAGVVALSIFGKIKKQIAIGALATLVLIDLVPVNLRFLSHDNFVSSRSNQVIASQADKAIMSDQELGYRVFNLSLSPFNDATTSYFHRSIGGYHGAKLARYQDLIDRYISKQDPGVLDMLNTRYIITSPEMGAQGVILRESANGAAWFVDSVIRTSTPHQEIESLKGLDTKHIAVIDDEFKVADNFGDGEIELVEYRPNYLKYSYNSPTGGVALFSEIYYNKGWSAYIDGEQAPYFRANYILRAMELPAGKHSVEWRFRAPQWGLIEGITLACSLAIIVSMVLLIIYFCRGLKNSKLTSK